MSGKQGKSIKDMCIMLKISSVHVITVLECKKQTVANLLKLIKTNPIFSRDSACRHHVKRTQRKPQLKTKGQKKNPQS